MLGTSMLTKYLALKSYVAGNLNVKSSPRRSREIQVTNYVHALRRGGLI
jgi:hypothetical protein